MTAASVGAHGASCRCDAVARVAHLVYLRGTYEEAGWRRPTWHQRLMTAAPELAALVADPAPGAAVLKLISRLRNTIHGEALRPIEVRRGSAPPRSLVELSPTETAKLEAELATLGETAQRWGLTHEHQRTYLAVDRYTEALLPHAVTTLNDLMAAIKIERLAGVDGDRLLAPPADLPSPNPIEDVFSYEIRQRVRLLAGL